MPLDASTTEQSTPTETEDQTLTTHTHDPIVREDLDQATEDQTTDRDMLSLAMDALPTPTITTLLDTLLTREGETRGATRLAGQQLRHRSTVVSHLARSVGTMP